MKRLILATLLGVMLSAWSATAHELACHRIYRDRAATLDFYATAFEESELLNVRVVGARMEAGRLLEQGVLLDMRGEDGFPILNRALEKMKESRAYMDDLYAQIGKLVEVERANEALPQHDEAVARLLENHPPLERVSLTNSRYAQVSIGSGVAINYGVIGNSFPDILENLREDLVILQEVTDQAIEQMAIMLPTSKNGGFAAMVLSGRAPLPEHIMHSADQLMVYVQFHNRACMVAIAADMQVYPMGLEWLPQPERK